MWPGGAAGRKGRIQPDLAAEPGRVLAQRSGAARLVVVATRGRGGFTGMLLGSTSQSVLHHASCPVLVVRPTPRRKRKISKAAKGSTAAP